MRRGIRRGNPTGFDNPTADSLAIAISVNLRVSTQKHDDPMIEPATTTVQLDGMIVKITLKILTIT